MTNQQDSSLSDAYSATSQKCHDIEQYLYELRKRLYAGKTEYADNSSDLPTSNIERERLEETLDVAGWSYVMWRKLRHMAEQQHLAKLMGQSGAETPDEGGKTLAEPNTLVDLGGAQAIVKSPEDLVNQIAEGLTEKRMLQPERYDDGDVWAVLLSDALDVVRKALMIEAPKS